MVNVSSTSSSESLQEYSSSEVASHSSRDDYWLVYNGKVFDATALVSSQCKATDSQLASVAGRDLTDFLHNEHFSKTKSSFPTTPEGECPAQSFFSSLLLKGVLQKS